MLEERKRRIGENEGVFRSVNERIQPLDRDWMTILCECGQLSCRDQLVIPRDEYARVREDPTMFILRPGHDVAETEEVALGIHIDYDASSRPVGIEVLSVKRRLGDGDLASYLRGLAEGLLASGRQAAE